jgi:hypothetical protein
LPTNLGAHKKAYMNAPNAPAKTKPLLALSVEAAFDPSVPLFMVPFSINMPLVPAVLFGETFLVAFAELILNFSSVLPIALYTH